MSEGAGQFDLTIECEDPEHQRPRLEHALWRKGVSYELWGSAQDRLRYEVTLPRDLTTQKLTKIIKRVTGHHGGSVEVEPARHIVEPRRRR